MHKGEGITANRLTIYKIKPEFKTFQDVVDCSNAPIQIGDVGQFVFEKSNPMQPAWVNKFFGGFLGDNLKLLTSNAMGIFLTRIKSGEKSAVFALSFGLGRHLLKEGVIEERFGLKVVLNSVKNVSFRSIDKTTLGSIPKHTREQMGREVSPGEFGIDVERDLVSSVTARSNDPKLGKVITGKDALHVSVPVRADGIHPFLEYCFERSRSKDYKENFDWIDQIAEVRNRSLVDQLDTKLIDKINRKQFEKVWMAVPEPIDWAATQGFRSLRAKRADLKEDLIIEEFISDFPKEEIALSDLRESNIFAISAESGDASQKWSAYRCVCAEMNHRGTVYVLNNAKWYMVAKSFSDEVERSFSEIETSSIQLPDCNAMNEPDYNVFASREMNAALMDRRLITCGRSRDRIEFCDIFTADKKLVHVKQYGGSSVLSHLFSQGAVSGELFCSDGEFRAKLNRELPRGYKLTNPRVVRPDPSDYEIVFAIISKSENKLDVPFFSKVSLRNAHRRLTSFGYKVTKKKIQKQ
jgi:uncharacterized protein (TIGR04141 family)